MTRFEIPFTLRLPFSMADRPARLEQILAAERSRPWAECLVLLAAFAMSRREQDFARRLMTQKRNLWLFRTNQRQLCGDFITVDMSDVVPKRRSVSVIELKLGAELRLGGGGAGNQFQRFRAALTELAATDQLITDDADVTLICGDADAILSWIRSRGVQPS